MKSLIFLALVLFFSSASTIKVGSYFKFDEVEHFHTDYKKYVKEDESIYTKSAKNQQEEVILNILLSQKTSFLDTVLIKNLEELGFNKSRLSADKADQLKKLFNPKKSKYGDITFCDPVYNDVLVFKKKNAIVGFAKICFGCGNMIFVRKNSIERYIPIDNISKIETLLKL